MFHVLVADQDQVARGYVRYLIDGLTQASIEETERFRNEYVRGMTFRRQEMLVYVSSGAGGPDWLLDKYGYHPMFIIANDVALALANQAKLQYRKIAEIPEAILPEDQWPQGLALMLKRERIYLT
jgi:hypothetical protein